MFQTEINHFFQSFETPALTAFMRFMSALGYMEFFILFLIILLLGIHYKKGFILFLVLLWTGAFTFIAKNYFSLPRPFHVDNTLQLLDGQLPDENTFTFSKRGATSFWEGLPPDVLETTRQAEHMEYGFPSGHTSIAIAFWGTLFCLYRQKWIKGICLFLMLFIPISRMYLGVHFLADVLGGLVLGGVLWAIIYQLILKSDKQQAFYQQDHFPIAANSLNFFLLLLPLSFLFLLPSRLYLLPALMIGTGLGFLLLSRKGLPINKGTLLQRIGRVGIGFLLFIGVSLFFKLISKQLGVEEHAGLKFIENLLAGLALFWLAEELAIRLGWYSRERV